MMNEEEIFEGNMKIGQFMGWVRHENREYDWHEMKHLKYHTSWDWLMPVVKKILAMDVGAYNSYQYYLPDDLGTADIGKVYESVLDFVEWHNQNPTP